MSPNMSQSVRFAAYLSSLPKHNEILEALSRDYLRDYGVTSVQLFSLDKNNLLELKTEAGIPTKFTANQMDKRSLQELEKLLSTSNVCREIASLGCLCDPTSSISITPFSIDTNLLGFFVFEWKESTEITKEAKEALILYSALTSLYLTQGKSHGLILNSNERVNKVDQKISPRQMLVLHGMVEGKTNHELATDLGYSVSTIRHETMAIFRALGVSDRKEAAQIAQQMDLI